MRPPRSTRALIAPIVAVALAVSACGGDDPPAGPAGTAGSDLPLLEPVAPDPGTAHPAGGNPAAEGVGPGFDSFSSPARVDCEQGSLATVPVTWSSPTARTVQLAVDGTIVADDAPPEGAADLDVACDGTVHVVLALAFDGGTEPSVASAAVLTQPGPDPG